MQKMEADKNINIIHLQQEKHKNIALLEKQKQENEQHFN